jgi:hypothetical protein
VSVHPATLAGSAGDHLPHERGREGDRVRLLRQVDGRSWLKRLEILLHYGQFVVKVVALDNLLDAANVR